MATCQNINHLQSRRGINAAMEGGKTECGVVSGRPDFVNRIRNYIIAFDTFCHSLWSKYS